MRADPMTTSQDCMTAAQNPMARDETALPGASRVLVTGCAGFIGSHLSERLVGAGCEVLGVDCFTGYYDREVKEANLDALTRAPGFTFAPIDLSEDDIDGLLAGVSHVAHLAGQPGVRMSFGGGFPEYLRHNVLATQRLLEEAVANPVERFVYASSSSVYGDAPAYPTHEASERRPVSPYGMTKLATEELAAVYHRTFDVPVIGLRYFTVYGPRQRPDMAFTRFLRRAVKGLPLPLNGTGRQVRDFTYVDDIIDGTIAAARRGRAGGVYNLGGGEPVELRQALSMITELLGHDIVIDHRSSALGDAKRTGCDSRLARAELGFIPRVSLRQGLASHLAWVVDAMTPSRVEVAS
jgi:nucleoside-diphosphate-sugar epimerase